MKIADPTWVRALETRQPHVIDYYFRDGRARLDQRLRDIADLSSFLNSTDVPLRPAEVVSGLERLRGALDREDPFYRYEFEVTQEPPSDAVEATCRPGCVMAWSQSSPQGCVTVRVFAKYPQATEDRPIRTTFRVDTSNPAWPAAMQESRDYGTVADLPDGAVRNLTIDAPGGLSYEAESAAVRLTGVDRAFEPQRMRLVMVDPDDVELATTVITTTSRSSGTVGAIVAFEDIGGAFRFTGRFDRDTERPVAALGNFELDHFGKPVAALLPGVEVFAQLRSPNRLRLMAEYGTAMIAEARCGEDRSPVGQTYLDVVRALTRIQQKTPVTITMFDNDDLTADLATAVVRVARLLDDGVVTFEWNDMSATVPEDAAEKWKAEFSSERLLALEQHLDLHLPHMSIPIGDATLFLASARITSVDPAEPSEGDGLVRVTFEPGSTKRAEWRLGCCVNGNPSSSQAA